MNDLITRLRGTVQRMRRTPASIAALAPLLQQAADRIEQLESALTLCKWPVCLPEHEQQAIAAEVVMSMHGGCPCDPAGADNKACPDPASGKLLCDAPVKTGVIPVKRY